MNVGRILLKFLLVIILFWSFNIVHALDYDSLYNQSVYQLQYSNPDSAKSNFILCLKHFEKTNNIRRTIDAKLWLITMYSGNGNYHKAYGEAWSLLPIVDKSEYREELIEVKLRLSSLYIIFRQFDRAHLRLEEAIKLAAKLEDEQKKNLWNARLLGVKSWLITNDKPDFKVAKRLLLRAMDKNAKVGNTSNVYLKMQLAELFIMNDSIKQAEDILLDINQQISGLKSIHGLLFDHMGQLYMKKKEYDSAVYYFKKCIEAIDTFKNHLDNKIEVLDSVASCYHYLGQNDKAFYYARLSTQVSNTLFGNKSSINKELFEIKNTYEEYLKSQRLELLEQERRVLTFKTIIYVSVLVLIIVALIVRSRIRTRRINFLKEKQVLEKKQQEYEIENKNKELTTAALKLIERDTLLDDIRKKLHSIEPKEDNLEIIRGLVSSINANKTKKWDEFEHYFTNVNEDFYKTLKYHYPELSSTDLKMCALIKLGLSSKEMADIMAIGMHSVNTSRSRIRKKMNLTRDINLIEYLSDIK